MRTKKQFGQHWLRNELVLDRIMAAAEILPSDRILEIGPGMGVLTRRLIEMAGAVVAVEIDRDLCAVLVKKLGHIDNFLLLQHDFLALDLERTLVDFPKFQQPNKVVANIPYNITGPILEKLLGTIARPQPQPLESIVLLVQKEVADRLSARPSTKAFGALTIRVGYLAECELICPVPARDFSPPPQVDSAVIRLSPRPFPVVADDPKLFDRLVKLGFATRRKMLRNNLSTIAGAAAREPEVSSGIERDKTDGKPFDREVLSELMQSLDLNPDARAEDLSIERWVRLANAIGDRAN